MNQNSARPQTPHRPDIQSLRQEMISQIDDRIADTLASLPDEYFQQFSDAERLQHFKALVALKVCDIDQEIMLRQQDGARVTVISSQNYPGQLARMMNDLPSDSPLVGAKIFTSADEDFIVDVFEYQTDDVAAPASLNSASVPRVDVVKNVMQITGADQASIESFMDRYHQNHEILQSPEEIAPQFVALRETEHINDIKVICNLKPSANDSERMAKITISAASSTTRDVIQRAADFLGRCNYDIRRAFCENVVVGDSVDVALLTFHVMFSDEHRRRITSLHAPDRNDHDSELLSSELESFLRMDQEVVAKTATGNDSLVEKLGDMERAESFCGLTRLAQHVLNFCRTGTFSHERVYRTLLKHPVLVSAALDRFLARFPDSQTPNTPAVDVAEVDRGISANLEAVNDAKDHLILQTFVDLTTQIQRCNVRTPRRRVLAFRMPGTVFENPKRGETPFAVFYVYGCGFDGVHVRFRDVARGGMRLVPTRNQEHYLFESSRVFDEAWRLASAQQLKNKDIAEGGSKAVVVVQPGFDAQKSGRDFVEGLLDLITDVSSTNAVDQPPLASEFLYLGPDENVSDSLIEWIVARSAERGYPFPSTIMSSKPLSGINHKKYGVTSEGVLVFLRYALIEHGLDPERDSFTVKLTGGPDGDVGGNAIRILIRDYPQQVKIVGISDGTGSASDVNGLDHAELLRLVEQGRGIAEFSTDRLSPQGCVRGLENEADVARRNHLYNDVQADVFLPAGGRPSTINATNWRDFLDEHGRPSSKIIVEGANLFITDKARAKLGSHGVAIVKDSSANKCGVICSSLEIIAAMLLTEEQFLEIKPQYIAEVLEILRELARTEAVCLFNEKLRRPELSLPEISVEISRQMIRMADLINDDFDQWSDQERQHADQFINAYLPRSLTTCVGPDICEKIPVTYRRYLIAAILSSRIVYREGCQGLASMLKSDLENLIRSQIAYEQQVRKMVAQLAGTDLPDRDAMIRILDFTGARGQRDLRMPRS